MTAAHDADHAAIETGFFNHGLGFFDHLDHFAGFAQFFHTLLAFDLGCAIYAKNEGIAAIDHIGILGIAGYIKIQAWQLFQIRDGFGNGRRYIQFGINPEHAGVEIIFTHINKQVGNNQHGDQAQH